MTATNGAALKVRTKKVQREKVGMDKMSDVEMSEFNLIVSLGLNLPNLTFLALWILTFGLFEVGHRTFGFGLSLLVLFR